MIYTTDDMQSVQDGISNSDISDGGFFEPIVYGSSSNNTIANASSIQNDEMNHLRYPMTITIILV